MPLQWVNSGKKSYLTHIGHCGLITLPPSLSQDSCEQVLKLHHGYQRVLDILTEKTSSVAGAKRGPSGAAPSKTEPSALSLQATIQLLRAVFRYLLS